MKKKALLGTLLASYLVAIAAASKNPQGLARHQQAMALQAATLGTLILTAPLLSTPLTSPATALAAVLGTSFILRGLHLAFIASPEDHLKTPYVRWDSVATTIGIVSATATLAYEYGGLALALIMTAIALPLLLAAPQMTGVTTMNKDLILAALDVSKKSYDIPRTADIPDDSEYLYDAPTGTLCGVTTRNEDTYIFFSGTSSFADWIRVNAEVSATSLPTAWNLCFPEEAKVHKGFLKAYSAVRSKLWVQVQNYVLRKGGSGRIVVTGHSLGGALATLASLDYACRLDPEDAKNLVCITFGSPQVGDGFFVKNYDALVPLSIRCATMYDPVPKALSTQFPHVKGYTPLASPPMLPLTHELSVYQLALQQSAPANAALMAAPLIFVCLAFFVFGKVSALTSKTS